ncbi:MAG: PRC-barrel domain-containing protein [Phycisphaerae bacterium]|nr:PRC-barrel domain-containing protein [Phycisphaerae bacterium]
MSRLPLVAAMVVAAFSLIQDPNQRALAQPANSNWNVNGNYNGNPNRNDNGNENRNSNMNRNGNQNDNNNVNGNHNRNSNGAANRNDNGGGLDRTRRAANDNSNSGMSNRPTTLRRASELVTGDVQGRDNRSVGRLEDIVIDAESGRIVYGVLGGGEGDQQYALPWSTMQGREAGQGFTLNVDPQRLRTAPRFQRGQWPAWADRKWSDTVHQHYGVSPFWNDSADNRADTRTDRPADRNNPGEKSAQTGRGYPNAWVRYSELQNAPIRSTQNDDVGRLVQIAIDSSSGRAIYGIVQRPNGMLHAVPWSAFQFGANNSISLTGSAAQFPDISGFSNDKWPDMTDENWAREVHRRFGKEPFWQNEK